jgi:hypothetical protein
MDAIHVFNAFVCTDSEETSRDQRKANRSEESAVEARDGHNEEED